MLHMSTLKNVGPYALEESGGNIVLPYSGFIPGGIDDGTSIVFSGRTHPNFNSFSINLCLGTSYEQDTALHFNPRFSQSCVVRNHRQSGKWGGEERHGTMPFGRSHSFEVHIKVEQKGYKIIVDGRHFCDFNHRLAKETIQYIYITGDVTIKFIQLRKGSNFPAVQSYPPVAPPPDKARGKHTKKKYTPGLSYPSEGAASNTPIYNPPIPFWTAIPGGIYPGKIIFILGTPNSNPSRFTVNLACGGFDSADVGLHFDARFHFGSDRNQVIRTHKKDGKYGPEEKPIGYFPFHPNSNFELMILAEHSSFKIAVNNQHFTEFFYRLHPLQRITHVNIVGDVRLSMVRFQ